MPIITNESTKKLLHTFSILDDFTPGGKHYAPATRDNLLLMLQHFGINLSSEEFINIQRNNPSSFELEQYPFIFNLISYNQDWINYIYGSEA